jgi:hypothetical protein
MFANFWMISSADEDVKVRVFGKKKFCDISGSLNKSQYFSIILIAKILYVLSKGYKNNNNKNSSYSPY